jgi:hypothetical protein
MDVRLVCLQVAIYINAMLISCPEFWIGLSFPQTCQAGNYRFERQKRHHISMCGLYRPR